MEGTGDEASLDYVHGISWEGKTMIIRDIIIIIMIVLYTCIHYVIKL